MVKRILACILCLILTIGICVYAAETQAATDGASAPPTDSQIPQDDIGNRKMRLPRPNGETGQAPKGMPTEGESHAASPDMQPNFDGENAEFTPPGDISGGRGGFPGGMPPSMPNGEWQMSDAQSAAEADTEAQTLSGFITAYATPLFSLVLLALAFVFVIFYKRKKY